MPYAATATPVRFIERTSAISPQVTPEASQQHVVLTDERLSAISDTALSRDDALTPEILAGIIDRACVLMQAAMARGDVQMARRYFKRIGRLHGLLESMEGAASA